MHCILIVKKTRRLLSLLPYEFAIRIDAYLACLVSVSLRLIERRRLMAVLTSPFSGFSTVSILGLTAEIVLITAIWLKKNSREGYSQVKYRSRTNDKNGEMLLLYAPLSRPRWWALLECYCVYGCAIKVAITWLRNWYIRFLPGIEKILIINVLGPTWKNSGLNT